MAAGHAGKEHFIVIPRVVAFRADASHAIGLGHVTRCLTLADALASSGVECHFFCREHAGNLVTGIRDKGHTVHLLPVRGPEAQLETEDGPAHSHWLGAHWRQDVEDCAPILEKLGPDWLVVDHYGLDSHWESALRPFCKKLMVIDDLADRAHDCELLLDQTLGRDARDYAPLLTRETDLLCGSQYALLRPEFEALRPLSLNRRKDPQLRRLLVSMGGLDNDNFTEQVLDALKCCRLPGASSITVVLGSSALWLDHVYQVAGEMPLFTEVRVDVSDMAQLMSESDLAIGAAGTTSLERCCLGLPSIIIQLAVNQRKVAEGLNRAGAARLLPNPEEIRATLPDLVNELVSKPASLVDMSRAAASIADGRGVVAVIEKLGA